MLHCLKIRQVVLCMLLLQAVLYGHAHAHHLWVISNGQELLVARGLAPDDLHAYNPARVSEFKAFAADGSAIVVHRVDESERTRFMAEKTPAFAAVTCAWGDRVNTPEGKKLISRSEAEEQGLTVLSSFQSTQYSASYFEPSIMSCNRLGFKLEIVALSDPTALRAGDKMPVQVFFEGQPLAGCKVGTGRKKSEIRTDQNGKSELEVGMDPMQVFVCIHEEPADRKTDYQQYMAFLIYARP